MYKNIKLMFFFYEFNVVISNKKTHFKYFQAKNYFETLLKLQSQTF